MRTLNEWLSYYGYEWAGEEKIVKGLISETEVEELINCLVMDGDIIARQYF